MEISEDIQLRQQLIIRLDAPGTMEVYCLIQVRCCQIVQLMRHAGQLGEIASGQLATNVRSSRGIRWDRKKRMSPHAGVFAP